MFAGTGEPAQAGPMVHGARPPDRRRRRRKPGTL